MTSRDAGKWADRQVDEALVTIATGAAVLYARRVIRRWLPKVTIGALVLAVLAAVAAAIAGLLGLAGAGGAAAWYRHRKNADTSGDYAATGFTGSNAGSAQTPSTASAPHPTV